MIKWEHSIFALPFALCGAMLAAGGIPAGRQLAWIVVAMVGARSAAMAFNRLADAQMDAANPRTRTRALPAGELSPAFVRAFVVVASGVFVLAAYELNRLAFFLSPLVLAVVLLLGVLWVFDLGRLAVVGVVLVALLLRYEHSLVRADDLSRLDAAFFAMNGVISVVFFIFVAADLLLPK